MVMNMARDLSRLTDKISTVAKESFEKANEKKIVWIKDEKLLDHPLNDEDITYTEDIEEHIRTEGFRFPIIVTKYGCVEEEKYYIVSGHRSRRAGRNLGKTEFPCIVEDYASETEVYHAILSGNTRRNRDPLDMANRYIKWDRYLDMVGFKGNRADKIGKCLGISQKQAEKYKAFTKIIPEFWELVRQRDAAKDGLYQLAPKSQEEQREIYNFFLICNKYDSALTVTAERNMINAWGLGARTYEEYRNYINAKEETKNEKSADIIKENAESKRYYDKDYGSWENGDDIDFRHTEKQEEMYRCAEAVCETEGDKDIGFHKDERLSGEDFAIVEKASVNEREAEKSARGVKVKLGIEKLNGLLDELPDEYYDFSNKGEASDVISDMAEVIVHILDGMQCIEMKYKDLNSLFQKKLKYIQENLQNYIKL